METAVFATTCKPGLLEPYWGMLALGRFCIATTVRPSRSVSKKRLGIIFLRRIETTWQNGSPDKQYYLLFIRAGVGGGGGGGGGAEGGVGSKFARGCGWSVQIHWKIKSPRDLHSLVDLGGPNLLGQ